MAELGEENKVTGVFGGVEYANGQNGGQELEGLEGKQVNPGTIRNTNLPVKKGFWSSVKAFWLQKIDLRQEIDWNKEIKVELTPYQQKVEDEINEFLHQEITWSKVHDFLFQEITFGKKK